MVFAGGLALTAPHRPRLVYNLTASAPIGLYRLTASGQPRVGDLVLVSPPETARRLAAERGYLPPSVPLVKRVAAVGGTVVCVADDRVTIDGIPVARRLKVDSKGRPLRLWSGCRRLGGGELFLLMTDRSGSFDSRYFGPVRADAVIGRLAPLWLP